MSFYKYLVDNYFETDSLIGELAREMERDNDFPKESSNKEEIRNYLEGCDATWDAIEAFGDAWEDYEANNEED